MRAPGWLAACGILAIPLAGAIAIPGTLIPESLVEGHTVLAVTDPGRSFVASSSYAAAVAILVSEVEERGGFDFPGVLWFNDQYLVDPKERNGRIVRPVCRGMVFVVAHGAVIDVDRLFDDVTITIDGSGAVQKTGPYVESYLLTDPLDHQWLVHRWEVRDVVTRAPQPVWTVEIMNGALAGFPGRSGPLCAHQTANCAGASPDRAVLRRELDRPRDDATDVARESCAYAAGRGKDFLYNALLLIPLDLLRQTGTKDHSLPDGEDLDDPQEAGNSHAYNPYRQVRNATVVAAQDTATTNNPTEVDPTESQEFEQLYPPHGGSSGTCPPTPDLWRCHATVEVDVSWDWRDPPRPPLLLFNESFVDVQGSTAPYYCEDAAACSPPMPR